MVLFRKKDTIMLEKKKQRKLSNAQIIALGFFLMIFVGSVLLSLPVATKSGQGMAYIDALFTATSASCVTGLVVADTFTNWSLFGQLIILTLIQVGGLGFIMIGVYVALLFKRRLGLRTREAIQESANTLEIAGVIRLNRKIIQLTLSFELLGGALLACFYAPRLGTLKGLYYGIFHAISAFCNAGFDLNGYVEPYSSFAAMEGNGLVILTLVGLITLGGIGYIVWDDLIRHKWHFSRYMLHTKVVLSTSAILVIVGTLAFWWLERQTTLANMTPWEQFLGALFSAVTPRTAGFNSVDTAALSDGGKILTMLFMFIGGSPGSTAGGIKTTTIAVLFLEAFAIIRSTHGTNVFGRRLHQDIIRKASVIFMINLTLALGAAILILGTQPTLAMSDVLFEVFSAIGTAGMSTGVTRSLTGFSKLIICFLMYCGRVGSLSFALVLAGKKEPPIQYPAGNMIVG